MLMCSNVVHESEGQTAPHDWMEVGREKETIFAVVSARVDSSVSEKLQRRELEEAGHIFRVLSRRRWSDPHCSGSLVEFKNW